MAHVSPCRVFPSDFQKRPPSLAINAIIAIDVKGGVGCADISIRAGICKRGVINTCTIV